MILLWQNFPNPIYACFFYTKTTENKLTFLLMSKCAHLLSSAFFLQLKQWNITFLCSSFFFQRIVMVWFLIGLVSITYANQNINYLHYCQFAWYILKIAAFLYRIKVCGQSTLITLKHTLSIHGLLDWLNWPLNQFYSNMGTSTW